MPVVTQFKTASGTKYTKRLKHPISLPTFRKVKELLAPETSARHTS